LTARSKGRSPRKAKGAGHLRRAEILEAAERIFVAHGYEGATIRRIAQEVGLSSTALYMHFPDKGAILREICDATVNLLLERNREISARPAPAAERVRAMLEAYMRWGLEHPNAYQLVYAVPRPLSGAPFPDDTLDHSLQAYGMFRRVVGEIAQSGQLRADNPDAAAQVLWMSCHGVVALLTARPTFPWEDRDALMRLALDGLMRGLLG